ncbi:MAG: hypothetical protein ACRC62_10975 [Microcoleus sp.]
MTTYSRDVLVTDAITGKVIKVYQVTSPTPISQSDAIHAVIRHEDKGGNG